MKKLKSIPSIPSFASAGILKITPNIIRAQKLVIEPRSPLPSFKELERQRRSYGNTVSLASLKKYFCVKTRFSTTATTVATGAIIWKPGLNYRFSFRKLQILISQTTDSHFANHRFSFRKLQIPISQTTDSHFANYRFSLRKLQIFISQTTDFHFANYRFPFRFVPFRFANYSKPLFTHCIYALHQECMCRTQINSQ